MLLNTSMKLVVVTAVGLGLAGCVENTNSQSDLENSGPSSTTTVERDVEAPEVFQVNEEGLWDGRPSLGGVWVAHPTAKDPERVLIRNEANGKFVIGALFRKERETPGPLLQVSSDAADAIGMLAGAPVTLNVTALRREEVAPKETPVDDGDVENAEAEAASTSEVTETTLDPIASASAALDAVDSSATTAVATTTAVAATPKASASTSSNTKQTYLQLGIYSIETNANATAAKMRKEGLTPTIKKQSSKGKNFWRVIVGPVSGSSEKDALKKTVSGLGYTDAYFVSN